VIAGPVPTRAVRFDMVLDYTPSNTSVAVPEAMASPPLVTVPNGVTEGAGFQPGIVSGSWITIFGDNLAPNTREWNPATEIVNGKFPTSLDGVSVTINNKPAYVQYVSPTQLNVQAPQDDALGPVTVVVTTASGESTPVSASMVSFLPEFFRFTGDHVAAVRLGGSYIGPPGLLTGVATTPAQPGQVIQLFGTGFGPTNPPVTPGEVFQGAAELANNVVILIGGIAAGVSFAGLAAAGLYQFNITVPNLPAGDHEVIAEIGGVRSKAGAKIRV
jgi:uncharacterized protein (TIGR03437 family)